MRSVSITCKGRVQGVYYRASTREFADENNISGWVKNLGDGSVLIYACGEDETIEKLINWCHHGPRQAVVSEVLVEDIEDFSDSSGAVNFEIRR